MRGVPKANLSIKGTVKIKFEFLFLQDSQLQESSRSLPKDEATKVGKRSSELELMKMEAEAFPFILRELLQVTA